MIYPSIDKLLTVVDSKYTLVTVASARSRQITETGHVQINDKESRAVTSLGKALEEIAENLIHIKH
ncbi:MAG TPA: DNA-directed RNA polymerase subunit omega [Mollicutes bacterium]|nr:DNA-directed RNA polymerase subunit omega [Mollicutes bacterium]